MYGYVYGRVNSYVYGCVYRQSTVVKRYQNSRWASRTESSKGPTISKKIAGALWSKVGKNTEKIAI